MPPLTVNELMEWLAPWHGTLLTFAFVLLRISGLLSVGPLLGQAILPWQVRIGLAVVLTLAVTPLVAFVSPEAFDGFGFLAAALSELGLGFLLGCGSLLLFWALPLAGGLIDQQSNLPESEGDVLGSGSVHARWLTLWGTIGFLICSPINGHLQAVQSLADSFNSWPIAQSIDLWNADFAASLMSQAAHLALRLIAPAWATLFLLNLSLGLVTASGNATVSEATSPLIRPVVAAIVILASLSGMNESLAETIRWNLPSLAADHIDDSSLSP